MQSPLPFSALASVTQTSTPFTPSAVPALVTVPETVAVPAAAAALGSAPAARQTLTTAARQPLSHVRALTCRPCGDGGEGAALGSTPRLLAEIATNRLTPLLLPLERRILPESGSPPAPSATRTEVRDSAG